MFHLPPDFPTQADIEDMHRLRRRLDPVRLVGGVVESKGLQEELPTRKQFWTAVTELEEIWTSLNK